MPMHVSPAKIKAESAYSTFAATQCDIIWQCTALANQINFHARSWWITLYDEWRNSIKFPSYGIMNCCAMYGRVKPSCSWIYYSIYTCWIVFPRLTSAPTPTHYITFF